MHTPGTARALRLTCGAALALAAVLAPQAVRAQTLTSWSCNATAAATCTFSGAVQMTVAKFTSATVSPSGGVTLNGGTGSVGSPTPLSATKYAAGSVDAAPVTVTAYSNAPWTVTFTPGTPTSPKNLQDFSWASGTSASCASGYTKFTNGTPPTLSSGNATAGSTSVLCIRTTLSWTADAPNADGTARVMTLPLSFTISAP